MKITLMTISVVALSIAFFCSNTMCEKLKENEKQYKGDDQSSVLDFQLEKKGGYVFLHRDHLANEYLWIFENGEFFYTYSNNNIIYDSKSGFLNLEKTKEIFSIYQKFNLKNYTNNYFMDKVDGLIVEHDRMSLIIKTAEIKYEINADTQVQPNELGLITDMLYKSVENIGETVDGTFIKSKMLDKIYTTSKGNMSQGEYFKYKGRTFYSLSDIPCASEKIKTSLTHLNFFFKIDPNELTELEKLLDSRSNNAQILMIFNNNYISIEIYKTQQRFNIK